MHTAGTLRRLFVAFAATVFLPALFLSPAFGDKSSHPNIVLIVADDLGYNELGCYGQKIIRTPNIDSIAAEGVRLTDFYSGNAVCAPSRCCLLTGKHPGHAYVRNNGDPRDLQPLAAKFGWEFPGQNPIPAGEVTLAEVLKQKNYATGAMGKWGLGHFGTTGDPNLQGFDLFYGFNCQRHAHNHYPKFLWRNRTKEQLPGNDRTLHGETYSQDKFVEVALDFVKQHKDQPFFLYLPFAVPHLSIQVPNESVEEYKKTIAEAEYTHRGYLKHPFPRAGYAAMITHMDAGVGELLKLLKELKLDDNTLVIFTSDNGPTYDRLGGSDSDFFESNKPFSGLKGSLREGGIRVPFVARWPKQIPQGTVSDHPAAFWDILPTIAEVTGTTAPKDIDGVSFAPTLLGKSDQQKPSPFLYWEFAAYGGQQAVRMGKWKGLRENMLKRGNATPFKTALYDLHADPAESRDVAAEHPDVVKQIETIMREQRTPSQKFGFRVLDKP